MSAVMIGAGRGASELARQLVAAGVRRLTILDHDRVGPENLDALPHATQEDVGRPKAVVLAESLQRNQPELSVSCLTESVTESAGLRYLDQVRADTLLSFVDSDAARLAVSSKCREALMVHIDCGTLIRHDEAGQRQMQADVRLFEPGNGCVACVPRMPPQALDDALYELAAPAGCLRRGRRIHWTEQRAGSLLHLNALACSLAVEAWLGYVEGSVRTSHWIRARWPSGDIPTIEVASVGPADDCQFCHREADRADRSQLAERLAAAVRAWKECTEIAEFWLNWRGTGDGSDIQEPCVALVQYAQTVGCQRDETLHWALDVLEKHNHAASAAWLFPNRSTNPTAKESAALEARRTQAAHVMTGLIAAVEYTAVNEKATFRALGRAAAAYDAAWQLTDQRVPRPKTAGSDLFSDSQSELLLSKAHLNGAFNDAGPTTSTLLVLEHLLRVLLSEAEPQPQFANKASLLVYGSNGSGYVEPMKIEAFRASQPALLLDPLVFGPTYLDQLMQQSLRLAFRCCRQSLLAQRSDRSQIPAIRMIPQLPLHVPAINGDSAGGLFAVSLLATARQQRLDRRRSATVALQLSHNSENDLAPLQPEDVQLKQVGHVSQKLRAAARVEHRLIEIAVHINDKKLWNSQDGRPTQPAVVGVSTLARLLAALRGDERYEEHLERRCDAIVDDWQHLNHPHEADPDWDIYDEHRFDRYVPPTYHVEKPLPHGEHRPTVEPDSEPVPGHGDACLVHMLKRLYHGHHNLVIYDRAGAGKTVFSWRMRTVAATPNVRQQLFQGRPPLIVRFHGGWPEKHGCPLPVDRALLSEAGFKQAVPDSKLRAECIRYALDQRRVLIILDSFDQFLQAHRSYVATLLQPDAGNDSVDARCGCRWIITSRVHSIDAMRDDLFDDRRWLRVRIDPFTPKHRTTTSGISTTAG